MDDYERACREWERDVDADAANLIRQGLSPWQARARATERVSERRRSRTTREATP